MKKIYAFFALVVVGFSAHAAVADSFRNGYGEAFIFEEGGVEFAVYPDGQFDFFFNPGHSGNHIEVSTPHMNISYNSGYNYDPFVQYDDFGAVIQIENVPVYYDYYGRIIQAGHVQISYNHFGRLARVGHLFLHYDHHRHFTHYTGYINRYNPYYVYRPWHRYYSRPRAHFAIVYNQPYRAHYHPNRMKYGHYKNYYKKHHKKDFRRSYYKPGDRVASYHRGRRTATQRDVRDMSRYSEPAVNSTRSNVNTVRERRTYQDHSDKRITSRREAPVQRRESTQTRSRTYKDNRAAVNRDPRTSSREVKRTPRQETRRSSTVTSKREPVRRNSRAREAQRVQRVRTESKAAASSARGRSSRGRG